MESTREAEDNWDEVEGVVSSFATKFASDGQVLVGVAVVSKRSRTDQKDKKDKLVQLYEFEDCAQLTNLESLLVRVSPSRCFHEELDTKANRTNGFKRRVENLMHGLGVSSRESAKKLYAAENFEQDLKFLTGADSISDLFEVCEKKIALSSLHALIVEEGFMEDEDMRGRFVVEVGQLDKYMRLDAAAVEALNLFPGPDEQRKAQAKEASLFGVLDHCKTRNLGSRLLRRWIRQPLMDLQEIAWRQDIIGALKEDNQRRQSLQDALRGVPDLDRLMKRIESGKAGLKEMYQLYQFVELLPRISNTLEQDESGDLQAPPCLQAFAKQVQELCEANRFAKYSELVESVVDLGLAPAEFRVKPVHDESGELARLSQTLEEISREKDEIRSSLEENELCDMNPKFESDPNMLKTYGFHFRINKKEDNKLKKVSKGKYLNVVSACIRWGTPELRGLFDDYSSTYAKLQKQQSTIIQQAVEVAATFLPLFEGASSIVAQLDVLGSLAHAAAFAGSIGYVRPSLVDLGGENRQISLLQARHPCLEMLEADGREFIPNDFNLHGKENNFQIITGPNMGGKSTYIRQLGTIIVMAQMGSFVPAEEACLPILDAVLARVGASDAQLRGVSTFMAEMIEASAIVKTATENSLVIIDELGRGTSTYDGFGLAWAISEFLAKEIRPFCLFATHFHELTALADHIPSVTNKHVTALAANDTITMLYTVNDGPCEQSFGINIAKMAGFPEDVVQCAKRKAESLESLVVIASKSLQNQSKRARLEKARSVVKEFASLSQTQAVDANFLRGLLA